MSAVSDATFDLFQLLVQRPFLVIDTEYTPDPGGDGDRLVSIAVVPVVRGKRTRGGELYREMNPGVPIDPKTTRIHGFTDAALADKKPFRDHARAILNALSVPDAVLVEHTGSDIRVLRRELERLDDARAAGDTTVPVGLADLPDLPIVDTSTLPRLLRLPGVGARGIVSLATLCQLTGVTNTKSHDARGDARATADALVKLLLHAAAEAKYFKLDDLLDDHDRGTTQTPKLPGYIRGTRDTDPELPPEHLARHDQPLTHAANDHERDAWIEMARECAALRCQHLRGEAALAAAENGTALFDPLVALLPALAQPGQPGTLLGAVAELIRPDDPATPGALAHTRALRWWAKQRPIVSDSTPCGESRAQACPDCRTGHGCPRDTIYQPVARIATLGERGVLSQTSIRDRLFGNRPDRRIHKWTGPHPEAAAYMAWMVVTHEDEAGRVTSAVEYLRIAMSKGLHLAEPRLAMLACQSVIDTGGLAAAEAIANAVLAHRTSDPAYAELRLWLTWHQQAAVRADRAAKPRNITHRRLARPDGRINPNPYLPI